MREVEGEGLFEFCTISSKGKDYFNFEGKERTAETGVGSETQTMSHRGKISILAYGLLGCSRIHFVDWNLPVLDTQLKDHCRCVRYPV